MTEWNTAVCVHDGQAGTSDSADTPAALGGRDMESAERGKIPDTKKVIIRSDYAAAHINFFGRVLANQDLRLTLLTPVNLVDTQE